jgi:hypothetical protein
MLLAVYENKIESQPRTVLVKGIRMIGCIAGSLGEALNLFRSGKTISKSFIAYTCPLVKINEAFQMPGQTRIRIGDSERGKIEEIINRSNTMRDFHTAVVRLLPGHGGPGSGKRPSICRYVQTG